MVWFGLLLSYLELYKIQDSETVTTGSFLILFSRTHHAISTYLLGNLNFLKRRMSTLLIVLSQLLSEFIRRNLHILRVQKAKQPQKRLVPASSAWIRLTTSTSLPKEMKRNTKWLSP